MEKAIPGVIDMFKRAVKTPKLKIVYGTDAVAGAHGRNIEEAVVRVNQGGQKPMDAIVSMTSLAAESLGMKDKIGAIAPGLRPIWWPSTATRCATSPRCDTLVCRERRR